MSSELEAALAEQSSTHPGQLEYMLTWKRAASSHYNNGRERRSSLCVNYEKGAGLANLVSDGSALPRLKQAIRENEWNCCARTVLQLASAEAKAKQNILVEIGPPNGTILRILNITKKKTENFCYIVHRCRATSNRLRCVASHGV